MPSDILDRTRDTLKESACAFPVRKTVNRTFLSNARIHIAPLNVTITVNIAVNFKGTLFLLITLLSR